MKPFPTCRLPLQNRKTAIVAETKEYNKLYNFGYLPQSQVITDHWRDNWPCLLVTTDAHVRNFSWQGSLGGIHVGSKFPIPKDLREPHKSLQFILENVICEDVGVNALNIFSNTNGIIRNCAFRGNWKLNPLVENGVGQTNLVRVNGGTVIFENCLFFNCLNPVLIKANSKVVFLNCHFSVCQHAILADGKDNPRKNDTFYGGTAGDTIVQITNCTDFKTNLLTIAGYGSKVEINNCSGLSKEDGGMIKVV